MAGALSRALAGLALVGALPIGGVAMVLLLVADTWSGRALGLGFVCLSVTTVLLPLALAPDVGEPTFHADEEAAQLRRVAAAIRTRNVRKLVPLGAVALVCLGFAWTVAPPTTEGALTEGLRSVWLGPARPSRLGLAWVTPERDQIVLATHLLWMVDPWLDREEAGVLRGATRAIYDEMDRDPTYGASGSALGLAYQELLGGPDVSGHVYVDLAPTPGRQPAIVFLHGFGGAASPASGCYDAPRTPADGRSWRRATEPGCGTRKVVSPRFSARSTGCARAGASTWTASCWRASPTAGSG